LAGVWAVCRLLGSARRRWLQGLKLLEIGGFGGNGGWRGMERYYHGVSIFAFYSPKSKWKLKNFVDKALDAAKLRP
jgi:hypothetical protein